MLRIAGLPLKCPDCPGELSLSGDSEMACPYCGRRFTVVDDVPLLGPANDSDQHAHQRNYFDTEFAQYGAYEVENWRASFNERIFAALNIPDGGVYLDVGVGGSGATVIEAARLGMTAVGCDLSVEGMLRAHSFAKTLGANGYAHFVVCAAERLPFPDESFACASAVAVLEHLDDDGQAAGELARVVKPGGLVWATVPHAFRYMIPPLWPVYWAHDRRIGHKRHYDAERLSDLMSAAGFDEVGVQFTGHAVKLVQFGLVTLSPSVRTKESQIWWDLERRDLRKAERPYGATQLSGVYRRRGKPSEASPPRGPTGEAHTTLTPS